MIFGFAGVAVALLIFLFVIRWILNYRLEAKRVQAGYYDRLAQNPAQAERVQADRNASRACKSGFLLIVLGIIALQALDEPHLTIVGLAIGVILIGFGILILLNLFQVGEVGLLRKRAPAIDKTAAPQKDEANPEDSKKSQ